MASRGSKKKKANNNNLVDPINNFQDIIKNLQIHEYMAVIKFVESEVNKRSLEIEEQFNNKLEVITKALDRNISAAMILKTDYELDEINDIFKYSWELIDEDNKKIAQLKKEGDGDWMKASEKYIDKLQDRAIELVNENVKQKKAVEILTGEFPKLSTSMIANAYAKAKECILENKRLKEEMEDDPDVLDAYNAIFGEDEEEKTEVKEVKNMKKEVNTKSKAKEESTLKILNRKVIMDVQGEFGIYHVEDNKVTIDDVSFTSKENVEEVYKKQIEHITKCKNEALSIYEMVDKIN